MRQRIVKSVSRYVMVGVSASLATWLASKGVDADSIEELTEIVTALVPALITVGWSLMKNSKEEKEVSQLKEEIKTLKERQYND